MRCYFEVNKTTGEILGEYTGSGRNFEITVHNENACIVEFKDADNFYRFKRFHFQTNEHCYHFELLKQKEHYIYEEDKGESIKEICRHEPSD